MLPKVGFPFGFKSETKRVESFDVNFVGPPVRFIKCAMSW